MIGKQEFVDLINSHSEQNSRIDDLSKVFEYAYGNPIIDWGFQMFDMLISALFNEDGVNWINYYLYENPEKCYYIDKEKVPLETLDDLWKVIKDYRK